MAEPKPYVLPDSLKSDLNNPYNNKYLKAATGQGKMESWQERQMNELTMASNARGEEYGKEAGLSKEHIAEDHFQTEQTKAVMRASMKEQSWENGITQLGFDSEVARRKLDDVKRHDEALRNRYRGMMTAVAKLVIAYYTGGSSLAAG